MMPVPEVSTLRLRLRPFVDRDAERMFQILTQEGVLEFFPPSDPVSLPRVETMIERALGHWEEHGYGLWAVETQESSRLVGRCGFQYLSGTDEVEIDFLLAPRDWGKGFATEAASTALQYGFDRLGLSHVVGIVHPANLASQNVLKKIGLTFDIQTEYFGMVVDRYVVDVS